MRLKYETLGANFLQDRYTPEELKSHWVKHKAEMQSAELRAQEYLLTKNGATAHQVEWEGLEVEGRWRIWDDVCGYVEGHQRG